MDLYYHSTRDGQIKAKASEAILQGLAPDGGLYVPESVPRLPFGPDKLSSLSYKETAFAVMRLFLTDYTDRELMACIDGAYDEKFDDPAVAPLVKAGDAWYLELFHGKTIAFKDMALSILPYLMTTAAAKNNADQQILILTATSGDTGKAALAGFADVPGTKIVVFYPKHGVSPIQEKQMVTQKGDNTLVVGIEGNFDDAQSAVKTIFSDPQMREEAARLGYRFSSANSINIGRLVPQIVYYVYAYGQMVRSGAVKPGEPVNIAVPTGNFGNILAAWYAKKMGLPVGKLICASNRNKVLYDFFTTGRYDRNREFFVTSSPSMDILISSNLERLIYACCGGDDAVTASLMKQLRETGAYCVTDEMRKNLADFEGRYATEEETAEEIAAVYRESGYVIDPHTAVASCAVRRYREESGDLTPFVIASTASPYKFTRSVMNAIDRAQPDEDDFALADRLAAMTGTRVPAAVEEIRTAPVLHDKVVQISEMGSAVLDFLK